MNADNGRTDGAEIADGKRTNSIRSVYFSLMESPGHKRKSTAITRTIAQQS